LGKTKKKGYDMWYNHLNEYLLEKWFQNNEICPCIFIKKTTTRFIIVAVYVDDLNLVGTPEELIKITTYLKDEFEMKDLGNKFFLSWFTYWTSFKWNICSSINVYKKGPEALLHRQCSSFEYTYGCLIT
jgi:hypothetical protein